jgi:hypothetical protein
MQSRRAKTGHPRQAAPMTQKESLSIMTYAPQISVANSPPRPLPVEPEGIPDYLKARRQFVVWRFEHRDGRWTKVPYNPGTDRRALTTDLLTWPTFSVPLTTPTHRASKYHDVGNDVAERCEEGRTAQRR